MESGTLAEQIKEHFKCDDASEAPKPPLKQPFVIGKFCSDLQRTTHREMDSVASLRHVCFFQISN